MSFFKNIKKGLDETAVNAALEAEYLKGKKDGFPHPPEVEEHIEIMRGLREEIPKLRSRISGIDDGHKQLADAEGKAGADFTEMTGVNMQHPQLEAIYRVYGDGKTHISAERYKLQALLHDIREEWKPLESDDLHDIKSKQDKTNRLCSDLHYFQKKNMSAEAADRTTKYDLSSTELIDLIHILRVKKESQIPGFLMRIAAAEAAFYRAAAQYAEQVEAQLRSIGPVTPVPNTFGSAQNTPNTFTSQGPPPPRPQHNSIQARALYTFNAESPQELSFQQGDILNILTQQGDWWTAEINGRNGLIPGNYVQLL
eukprot:TRINITY_DN3554_c0_g1_i1.p1 TRINITY_DN3554_c0_g1~~TRINITY_DN3554_c0_g1_i1.p1  ORF type:complete len:312 (+),score=86.55 TRINITY_DN3554_c0_g1_i1:110-1045(+)